jgi:hypothetical protein
MPVDRATKQEIIRRTWNLETTGCVPYTITFALQEITEQIRSVYHVKFTNNYRNTYYR